MDLGIAGMGEAVEVGRGGFGAVYRVQQVEPFERVVAVKVLWGAAGLTPEAQRAFRRECQAMGRLADHPNIVTVHDAGLTSQGLPYLTMAYLPGGSIQDRLDAGGLYSTEEALVAGVKLAGALESAHAAGVVHRDVKPANVLVSAFGEVLLTDFGIARVMNASRETATGPAFTLVHAPPEVLDGQRADEVGDVYSLGSTLYALVAGRAPFEVAGDSSRLAVMKRVAFDPPEDLRPLGVAPALWNVLESTLSKEPRERPQSASVLGEALQQAQQALGFAVTPVPVAAGAVDPGGASHGQAPAGLPVRHGDQDEGSTNPVAALPPPAGGDRNLPRPRTTLNRVAAGAGAAGLLLFMAIAGLTMLDGDGSATPNDGEPSVPAVVIDAADGQLQRGGPEFSAISAGSFHTCGVRADESLTCWGSGGDTHASPPTGAREFGAVAAGTSHTCGIGADGHVICWGSRRDSFAPGPGGRFIALSAGFAHNCGLRLGGTVACWGDDGEGQAASPPDHDEFIAVTAGGLHTCAIRVDDPEASSGTVTCWGSDSEGQSSPPSQVRHEAGATHQVSERSSGQFRAVAAGFSHTCGIRLDRSVACWGSDAEGQSSPPDGEFS